MIERLNAALEGRYRVERELGQGGMATVYLARDLRHERDVAVKVLKPELAAVLGAERFVQEIKTTAALQHPHILPLFDSGTADGFLFYVMPLVQGETLRARLDRETQLGVGEAVRIAREVADALDHAHAHGIIHRDIKPENILLSNGRPMVADFGIALAVSAAAGGRMTETGTSIGTPHYMSPEQATADKELTGRSDVYSLAAVLYEMLTGDPPHTGSSAQQVVMKIIADTPRPVAELRKSVPPNVAAALAQALEKLPADRFDGAKAFADALANPALTTRASAAAAARPGAGSWRGWIRDPRSWVALAAVGVLAALSPSLRPAPTSAVGSGTLRFSIEGPLDGSLLSLGGGSIALLGAPVVSADGRVVAFAARRSDGHVVYLRRLDTFELLEIPGGGLGPFFSPDSERVAYFRGLSSEVWTFDLAEAVPTRIGRVSEVWWDVWSAVWHPDGRILVAAATGLWALPAGGGDAVLLQAADASGQERFEDVGVFPDGRILLHVSTPTGWRTEVVSTDGEERREILPGLEQVQIVDDVLFYVEGGQARATFFDARRMEAVGPTVVLPDQPRTRLGRSIAWVSGSGVRDLEPVRVSPDGVATPLAVAAGDFRWPRISPDGARLALGLRLDTEPGSPYEIETVDLRSGARSAVPGDSEPVWSIDGRHVFTSRGNRPFGGLLMSPADGSRAPDTLLALDRGDAWPTDVSPDGRWLAYYGATLGSGERTDATDPNDLMFIDLATRESTRVRIPGSQRGGRFSPDGRWLAYRSTETGEEAVLIRPWPGMDARYQVSDGGGAEPLWAPDGRTLYYRLRDQVMEVAITVRDGAIERAAPRLLFAGDYGFDQSGDQSWDMGPDGRFLMLRPVPGEHVDLRVTLDWIAEVRARLERAR